MADAWMPSARCIRAETDGGQLGGGAPRVVWLTLGTDDRVISVCSAAQRLNQESRPPHLVWDPLTGDVAQLVPIVRAGCALGAPEDLEYAPDKLPHRQAGVNREGRLCVQIGVLASAKDPFTRYQMIGLGEILGWLDSWQIPRRWPWPAGPVPAGGQASQPGVVGPGRALRRIAGTRVREHRPRRHRHRPARPRRHDHARPGRTGARRGDSHPPGPPRRPRGRRLAERRRRLSPGTVRDIL